MRFVTLYSAAADYFINTAHITTVGFPIDPPGKVYSLELSANAGQAFPITVSSGEVFYVSGSGDKSVSDVRAHLMAQLFKE